jgi:transcriptional regulator with XRE-family HTH domain
MLTVKLKSSELGQKVKEFRLERGWSQEEMAAYLGLSRVTVNKIEGGKVTPLDLTIAKIQRKLAVLQGQAAVA